MKLRIGQEQPFEASEFAGRQARVVRELKQRGLDGVLLFAPENIFWLTGFQTVAYFTFQGLLVPREGLPSLITRKVNRAIAGITPTTEGDSFWGFEDNPVDVLAQHLDRHFDRTSRVGIETHGWSISIDMYRRLIDTSRHEFIGWGNVVERMRIVKSDAEIEKARVAGKAAVAGLAAALEHTRVGVTENDLAAAMHAATFGAGGEYVRSPLVSAGERTALLFASWRRRKLAAGDPVLIEAAACIDRYHGMITRTAILGKATDLQKRAAEAAEATLAKAVELIRPGAECLTIDAQCRQVISDFGFEPLPSVTAYSIGVAYPPRWWEGDTFSIGQTNSAVLEKNMIFHIVPTVMIDEFSLMTTASVRVRDDGCEVLTEYPMDLFERS